jgi:hypothetical protein
MNFETFLTLLIRIKQETSSVCFYIHFLFTIISKECIEKKRSWLELIDSNYIQILNLLSIKSRLSLINSYSRCCRCRHRSSFHLISKPSILTTQQHSNRLHYNSRNLIEGFILSCCFVPHTHYTHSTSLFLTLMVSKVEIKSLINSTNLTYTRKLYAMRETSSIFFWSFNLFFHRFG